MRSEHEPPLSRLLSTIKTRDCNAKQSKSANGMGWTCVYRKQEVLLCLFVAWVLFFVVTTHQNHGIWRGEPVSDKKTIVVAVLVEMSLDRYWPINKRQLGLCVWGLEEQTGDIVTRRGYIPPGEADLDVD